MLLIVYCIQIQIPIFNLNNHNTTPFTHYYNIGAVAIEIWVEIHLKTIVKCILKEMQQMPLAGRWRSTKHPNFVYWRNKCSHKKNRLNA